MIRCSMMTILLTPTQQTNINTQLLLYKLLRYTKINTLETYKLQIQPNQVCHSIAILIPAFIQYYKLIIYQYFCILTYILIHLLTPMYSINSGHKTSFFTTRKNQLRRQIRRQQLDTYFSQKRHLKLQQDLSENQKHKYLTNFAQLLQSFFHSKSDQQAQNHIKIIWDELSRDDVSFQDAILLQPTKLVKLFILFPQNRYSVQILYLMIDYCYDKTFGFDDQKFGFRLNDRFLQVKIDRKDMTEYQEALDTLMKMIHKFIPELQNRKVTQYLTSVNEVAQATEHNIRIERKLKMYMVCLGIVSMKVNSFIMRYDYVREYASIWSKWLLIDYKYCQSHLVRYLILVVRFIIPFRSLSDEETQKISPEQFEAEKAIVYKLFQFCVPQSQKERLNNQKIDIMSVAIICSLFSDPYISIGASVHFFEQIMRLLRVVLIKRKSFKQQIVKKVFSLISNLIDRFVQEESNQKITQEERRMLHQIGIIDIFQSLQFLETFSLYLLHESWCYQEIFSIIRALIEYCVVFNQPLEKIINHDNIFIEICHKISYDDPQIMETNLKSLEMMCRYAQVLGNYGIFTRMYNYGVKDALQNLVYSLKNQELANQARQILELYFTQSQVDTFMSMEEERERNIEREDMEMPDRRDIYDYD